MKSEYVTTMISFLGGLGMFIYGLNIMAEGLQKSAGARMKNMLGVLTKNKLLAVLAGAAVTAIIQSSAGTTIMVVGFVNAGIMTLLQATGVIMGANIGTTITSWLVSMNQWGSFFRPQYIAPIFVCISAFIMLISKQEKKRMIGEIMFGFGILFIGFGTMNAAVRIYAQYDPFLKVSRFFGSNPFICIITGIIITALLQSSSVSVGIVQALAVNRLVNFQAAVFITLGQNIGTCVTALISSAGTQKTAKRAAVIHLLFNVTGAFVFGIAIFIVFQFVPSLAGVYVNSIDVSLIHTIFNVSCTLLLFPFMNVLVKTSGWIVGSHDQENEDNDVQIAVRHLDKRLLESPSVAVAEVSYEVVHMGEVAYETAKLAFDAIITRDGRKAKEVFEKEKSIDEMTDVISDYLVKISSLSLTEEQHTTITNLFYTVSNFERMGDHSENLAELCRYMIENDIYFSQPAYKELEGIMEIVTNSFVYSIRSRRDLSAESAKRAKGYENLVDQIEEELRKKHMMRLANELCKPTSGVVFLDILSNLERISDHADNVAGYVLDEL